MRLMRPFVASAAVMPRSPISVAVSNPSPKRKPSGIWTVFNGNQVTALAVIGRIGDACRQIS